MRTSLGNVALGAALVVTLGAPAAPAAAQEEPPPTTARASFEGGCADTSNPPGLVSPPAGASIDIVVPASVEPGQSVELPVVAVNDKVELGREVLFANVEVSGGSPAVVETSAFAFGPYQPLAFTVTGPPGGVVELRLASMSWAQLASIIELRASYACAAPGGPGVTVQIRIAGAECQGVPATLVAGPDALVVTGTAGDDVIVARAPGAVVTPGGGHDLVCAEGGGATLSFAASAHGVLADLGHGIARDAAGGTVRFTGVTGVDGSPRTDLLVGSDGADVLRGGGGSDVLVGRAGADTLDGGPGVDLLVGDAGDTCTSGIALGC